MGYNYFQWFTWSIQKQRLFSRCPKQYYNRYVLTDKGWLSSAPILAQTAYRLSKMTSIPMFRGTCIHEGLEQWIRERSFSPSSLAQKAVYKIQELVDTNNQQRYLDSPKQFPPLHEIYYEGLKIGSAVSPETLVQAERPFHYWYSQFQALNDPHNAYSVREQEEMSYLWIENKTISESIPVMLKLDLLLQTEHDESFLLLDWKTGKSKNGAREQALLYAAYLQQTYDLKVGDFKIEFWYVDLQEVVSFRFQQSEIDAAVLSLQTTMETVVRHYTDWQDITSVLSESFPKNEGCSCYYCAYKELCFPESVWKEKMQEWKALR